MFRTLNVSTWAKADKDKPIIVKTRIVFFISIHILNQYYTTSTYPTLRLHEHL